MLKKLTVVFGLCCAGAVAQADPLDDLVADLTKKDPIGDLIDTLNARHADPIGDLINSINAKKELPESLFLLAEDGNSERLMGHYQMCKTMPSAPTCKSFKDPDAVIHLTKEKWDIMNAMNLFANAMVEYTSDKDLYGVEDLWMPPDPAVSGLDLKGDCEDIALLKIGELIKRGFPDSALRLAVGITPEGEGHAVVVAKTDKGDFILDNMTSKILPIEESKLSFRVVQSAVNPRQWKTTTFQFRL